MRDCDEDCKISGRNECYKVYICLCGRVKITRKGNDSLYHRQVHAEGGKGLSSEENMNGINGETKWNRWERRDRQEVDIDQVNNLHPFALGTGRNGLTQHTQEARPRRTAVGSRAHWILAVGNTHKNRGEAIRLSKVDFSDNVAVVQNRPCLYCVSIQA